MSAQIDIRGQDVEQYINVSKNTNLALETSLTWASLSDFAKSTTAALSAGLGFPTAGQGTQWAEDSPTGIANENTIIMRGPANNTALNINYAWRNYRKWNLDKLVFNVCFAMNASANGNNDVSFDSVTARLQKFYPNGVVMDIIPEIQRSTSFSTLTGAGAQAFILEEPWIPNQVLESNTFLLLSFQMNCTAGTATRQEGIVPLFSYNETNASKWYSQSGVYLTGHYLA